MQKKSFIIRLFSTFLVCQILMLSVYGRTLSVQQAHHFGKNKCKIDNPNERHQINSNIRILLSLNTIDAHREIFPSIYSLRNISLVAFQFEPTSFFKYHFYQILFEHFIAKNAP